MAAKFLRVTDEITTCDCCGKRFLMFTVVLQTRKGIVQYYGSDCAEKALGRSFDHKRKWFHKNQFVKKKDVLILTKEQMVGA